MLNRARMVVPASPLLVTGTSGHPARFSRPRKRIVIGPDPSGPPAPLLPVPLPDPPPVPSRTLFPARSPAYCSVRLRCPFALSVFGVHFNAHFQRQLKLTTEP